MTANDTNRRRLAGFRSPNGVPIQVMAHMTVEERAKLQEIAELEQRSISGTMRMLMLRGMQGYADDTLAAD